MHVRMIGMSILLMGTGSFQVTLAKTLSEMFHAILWGSQEVCSVTLSQ